MKRSEPPRVSTTLETGSMAQVFGRSANTLARVSLAALVILGGATGLLAYELTWSSYNTRVGLVREQPVPFSHEHHVAGLGLSCLYCHQDVEKSSFAGMPATSTCMNCHSQVWTDAPLLQPVRDSWRSGQPLHWTRVHNLPDFVYFNHSVHINSGIGCATCHGQVDRMPLMAKSQTLYMKWCLECHRAPEKFIRPRQEVLNMEYQAPANQLEIGRQLVRDYGIDLKRLTNCTVCHR